MKQHNMNWTILLVAVVVIGLLFVMKNAGLVPEQDVLKHMKQGALVIDVRSPEEFNSGHLPEAINIPVDQIETALPQRVKDRNQTLLLHCASGMRSGVAQKKLVSLGYVNAHNLGSYGRAESLLKQH